MMLVKNHIQLARITDFYMNVKKCLFSVYLVNWIFGLLTWESPIGNKLTLLSAFYNFISFICYSYVYRQGQLHVADPDKFFDVEVWRGRWAAFLNWLLALIIILLTCRRSKVKKKKNLRIYI